MPDTLVPATSDPVATLLFFLLVFGVVGVVFLFIHLFVGSFIRPRIPDKEKLTIYECGEPTVGSAWIQFDLRFYVVALLFVIFDVEVAFFFPWAVVFGKANQLAQLPEKIAEPKLLTVEERQKQLDDLDKLRQDVEKQPVALGKKRTKGMKGPAISPEDQKKQLDEIAEQRAAIEKQEGLTAEEKKARLDEFYRQNPAELRRRTLSKELLPSGLSAADTDRVRLTKTSDQSKESAVVPIEPKEAATWAKIAFLDIMVFFGVLLVGFAYVWRRGDIDWVRAFAQHQEPPTAPEKPVEQQKVGA